MSEWQARVFWEEVEVIPLENGFGITLDSKLVKTPKQYTLKVPTKSLALGIEKEFLSQHEVINPNTMEFTRLANTAIDQVTPHRERIVHSLTEYAHTDLLYHFAPEPQELTEIQEKNWKPLIQWIESTLGVSINSGYGIMPIHQHPETIEVFQGELKKMNNFLLTSFSDIVPLLGSLILGLALLRGLKTVEETWHLSRIDTDYQSTKWGKDHEDLAAEALKKKDFIKAYEFAMCSLN